MIIPEIAFPGLSVMTIANLLQLPPVREKLIFSQFLDKDSMRHLLRLQLWHLFKYAELTGVVIKKFLNFLNELPAELYTIDTNDKIEYNCKYPLALIQAVQNQNQTNTGGLVKFLKLKVRNIVMLTINTDIQDRLINGQAGIIRHIEFS